MMFLRGGSYVSPLSLSGLILWIDCQDSGTVTASGGDIVEVTNKADGGATSIRYADTGVGDLGTSVPPVDGELNTGKRAMEFDGGTHNKMMFWDTGYLTSSVFDIYIAQRIWSGWVGQTSRVMLGQHKGAADAGRTNFIGVGTTNTGKPEFFRHNGSSSASGQSTQTAYDNNLHVIRVYSSGDGSVYVQVDHNAAELVVSGSAWTPLATPLRIAGIGSGSDSAVSVNNEMGVWVGELHVCNAVQSSGTATANISYLLARWA